jgi:isocitrate/isopropylmalate dehydrogenase
MNKYKIVILPGDGAGQEVMAQSERILEVVERAELCSFDVENIPCAGSYYVEHGQEWPDGSLDKCKAADAIMLGAIGHLDATGKPVRRSDGELAGYEQVLGLRMKLDLYANIRPVRLLPGVRHLISGTFQHVWSPDNVNMTIIRENTEGAYTPGSFTLQRHEITDTVVSPIVITREGAQRVARQAFLLAEKRSGAPRDGVKRVTCVDKSNVIRAHRFFRDTFREVAQGFPDIAVDFGYVDSFCQSLVREPENYDVVVAPNLPGDVITDLAAVLQGGMGMAASGNCGDDHAMFEPIHGSAPDRAGKDIVNPIAAILSTSMMLSWLGDRFQCGNTSHAGKAIESAIADALANDEAKTDDLGGKAKTSEATSAIIGHLEKRLRR